LKLKRLFIWASLFIVLLGIWFYWGYLKAGKELREAGPLIIMEGPSQIVSLAMDFGEKYSRWPKNVAELQKFIKDKKRVLI
jgi:hypothetical protein